MHSYTIVVGVIVGVLIVAAALLFFTITPTSQPATVTSPPPNTVTNTDERERVVSFTLYLWDYGFNASRGGPTLTVHVGDRVRLTLVGNSSGPTVHDFALDKDSPSPYNVRSNRLSRGEREVLEFVANYPGTFKYYCTVAPPFGQSHRERGQEGTIVVLER